MRKFVRIGWGLAACVGMALAAGCSGGEETVEVAATCGGQPSCLNDKGQENLGLCPAPQSEWSCIQGCCVEKMLCKSNAECAVRLGTDACPDGRFTCGCDVESGACIQTMCANDSGCADGQQCHQGGCRAPLTTTDLSARLLRPVWIGAPGAVFDAAIALGAQAVDGQGNVEPKAAFVWQLATSDAFTLADGKLTATGKPGHATITATVVGASKAASAPADLWNLGPLPQGQNLRVTVVDDVKLTQLTGHVVVIGLSGEATPVQAPLADGQAAFAGVQFPCDIHFFNDDHAPVSVLGYDPAGGPADVVLPSPLHHFAEIAFDADDKLDMSKTTLVNADLLGGTHDYPGTGEAALGLTSLAFGPSLLNFSVDSILGPTVQRPFDKDAPSFVNPDPSKPQEVPGGITFVLGKPVVTSYVLAGPPGNSILWTLAGRLSLTELLGEISKIFDAVDGGLDVGKVVSVLLPHLAGFQSQVVTELAFASEFAPPMKQLNLAPTFPLGLLTQIKLPTLPKVGEGWADLAFVVGGALLPSGDIVPLGLTAGSDSIDKEDIADGKIDGDAVEPGTQPLPLSVAPLHSGLRVGEANHVLVTAAIILGGNGKKEGGSILIGAPGAITATVNLPDFLAFPAGSSWNAATREVLAAAVDGSQFYRVTLIGPQNRQWLVVAPGNLAGKTLKLPDLTLFGAKSDPTTEVKRALVAAFELAVPTSFPALVGPGGLTDLVRQVRRTAFLDATP
jgi:hypothetical protein